ncbi:hypothetical protein MKEN_00229700 [Mycena kentingensis (nom. inval.)]|nr:hypothetical protein MKEN_00229700 [Mycena kentingensis (nom. inval.)]
MRQRASPPPTTMSSDSEVEIVRDPVTKRPLNSRRVLFEPVIGRVVDALGGYEAGVYRMGDEANGCLKDLKKLWRKDDSDDERTISRIFWEKRVLSNDLVPILLLTAGAGQVDDRRAISAADLISAMTWPIDVAEELAELEPGERADFTQLQEAHRHYKATLLQPAVMSAIFAILLPPLAKAPRERTLRDNQVASLVLNIVRNLAAIRDREGLQSKLLRALQDTHIIDLMLTIATNSEADPLMASWNTLVLEILFLLFRGTPPATLMEKPKAKLQSLLAAEARSAPTPVSRHSRFGTTIVVTAKQYRPEGHTKTDKDKAPAAALIHKNDASTGSILDARKKASKARAAPAAEAALMDDLTPEARDILRTFVHTFLHGGVFDAYLAALFKDIRMERAWATGARVPLWLMAVVRWILTFFLLEGKDDKGKSAKRLQYGLVASAAESGFVSFVLRHMREATDEKPKAWAMLYAGMGCLTQILQLLDHISNSSLGDDDADADAAQTLRTQLIYAGLPLDLSIDALRACTAANADGRGPAFLDAAVTFAYAVVRMVEREGSDGEKYVRRKKSGRKRGDEDDEDRRREEAQQEISFSLAAFEARFSTAEVVKPLLLQLSRFKEMHSNPEALRRVVGLLHRVAVRGKAEGLFFKVSTLHLFQSILAAQKSFPRDQPHKDLVSLVNFILRKFFKALEEEPFLAVEAFFPKNRGQWKAFSSWEAPVKEKRKKAQAELKVKGGRNWGEQLGVVVTALIEAQEVRFVTWTLEILETVLDNWQRVRDEVKAEKAGAEGEREGEDEDGEEDSDEKLLEKRMAAMLEAPSAEMLEKMADFKIPYTTDEEADAGTNNARVRLLFQLAEFVQEEEVPGVDERPWVVPKSVAPARLGRTKKCIEQYLAAPMTFEDGQTAKDWLTKKQRPRARKQSDDEDEPEDDDDGAISSPSSSSDDAEGAGAESDPDGEGKAEKRRKKKERKEEKRREKKKRRDADRKARAAKAKAKAAVEYKSAQFIEDSDEEYGAMDEFLAREKEMRERIEKRAAETGKSAGMLQTGTKARKRKKAPAGKEGAEKGRKKRKGAMAESAGASEKEGAQSDADDDNNGDVPIESEPPRPRPKPKPRFKGARSSSPGEATASSPPAVAATAADDDEDDVPVPTAKLKTRKLVISDDDE